MRLRPTILLRTSVFPFARRALARVTGTPAGRDTLCRLCKGDNPRNSLNERKLQAMIDKAREVMAGGAATPKEKRRRDDDDDDGVEPASEAHKAMRLDGGASAAARRLPASSSRAVAAAAAHRC
eukprot:5184846-Prymnesium_polylepis.1